MVARMIDMIQFSLIRRSLVTQADLDSARQCYHEMLRNELYQWIDCYIFVEQINMAHLYITTTLNYGKVL